MTEDVCRWVEDEGVPGGRFLVPGCWNRVVNGDFAECHCPRPPKPLPDEVRQRVESLAALLMDEDEFEAAMDYLVSLVKGKQ